MFAGICCGQHVLGEVGADGRVEAKSHIAPEHGVLGAELMIDLADVLIFVVLLRNAEPGVAALVLGHGQSLGHLERRGTQRAGGSDIVNERRGQCDVAALTGGRGERAEIAADHRWRRYRGMGVRRRPAVRRALKSKKEKHLIRCDRPAGSAAVLVSLQIVLTVLEKVARVEHGVADKPERVAVELVRAGFR